MSGGASAGSGPLVFVSYSREDEQWRRRFTEMLKPLVRERRLEVWSDDREEVGREWRPQLAEAITRSRAALLLVSPSFLASDFIIDQELPALIEHGVHLVPVLVRPCLWQQVPMLERVQWAHDPRRDGPVAGSADPEGQIVQVCLKLDGLLAADGAAPETGESVVASATAAGAVPLAAGQQLGDLHGVPMPPRALVAREELPSLRAAVLGAGDGVVGVTGAALGLHGQGGIGKTVLAAELARDEEVRRCFPDGVFWVTVGERGDLVTAQIGLLDRLGVPHPELRSAGQGLALLREVLADRRCLLVVDDVWSTAAAAAFRAVGPAGRVLYTTRDSGVLEGVAAQAVPVGVLPRDAARQLLVLLTGVRDLPAEADRICEATGGVALAVALVGAAIGGGGRSWAQAAGQLDRGGATFLDHPYANTFKAMQVGVAALGEDDALAYRSLAVYPEDTVVPVAAVGRLWLHLWGASAKDAAARLDLLAARSLLTMGRDGVSFHDLQREFLLLYTDDLSLAHADLLATYRALLPPDAASWAGLPPGEPYIWDNLVYHLRGAGDGAAIRTLACDLAYLAMRCFLAGPYAAQSDLRQAADLYPYDEAIGWLLRLFAQWGHLFTQHPTVGDLAVTLASRVHDAPAPIDAGGLAALLPACYLAPEWGLPAAQPSLARVLQGHTDGVTAVAFTPDGRQLASASADGTVRLWDPAAGRPAATLESRIGPVLDVAFSPDGRVLASAGDDDTVRLRDPATGQLTATIESHAYAVTGVAFSPDGRVLAGVCGDGTVRLWDPATGQLTATIESGVGPVLSAAFSPDGRVLAGAGGDGTVRLWDPATGQLTATLETGAGWVNGVAFSPDGRVLASAGGDGTVRLWDLASGQLATTFRGHEGVVRSVAFSPDGRVLASGGVDGTVRLWDLASGQLAATFRGHDDWIRSVAFSPDGRVLASASNDRTVRLWDPASGQPGATVEGHTGTVYCVAFSPDGRLLASGGADAIVRLWNPATGQPGATVEGHTGAVYCVAFSPDGRLLASGGGDAIVRLWDPGTGQSAATIEGHFGPVESVAFSPDGRLLASVGEDGIVRLWDPGTGQSVGAFPGPSGARGVAFSPDGRLLANGGGNGRVRLWDLVTRQPAATFEGHTSTVYSVAFSPDGRLLASIGGDDMVRLWDLVTGQPAATFGGHTRGVRGMAFSPDGPMLASGDGEGTVRMWDARSAALVSQLKAGASVRAIAWGRQGIAVAGDALLLQLAIIDRAGDVQDS